MLYIKGGDCLSTVSFMRGILKILSFMFLFSAFTFARGNDVDVAKSAISAKINQYQFEVGDDLLYKKRSHKRRKIKRKPRRGRDNR